jgi:hypothetical protein
VAFRSLEVCPLVPCILHSLKRSSGSFGLGALNPDNSQARRRGELYGNRVPGLNAPNGPPLSRSGSPLPTANSPKNRRFSISDADFDRSPSPNGARSPMLSETEESPASSPIHENSQRSRRSSFTTALDAARRRESMDFSKFDFDQGFPSPSPSPSSHTRYLPSMVLVEDQEEEVKTTETVKDETSPEDTPPAPAIVVSSEEGPAAVAEDPAPDEPQEAEAFKATDSPPVLATTETSHSDGSLQDGTNSNTPDISNSVLPDHPDEEMADVLTQPPLSPTDSKAASPAHEPSVQRQSAASIGRGRGVDDIQVRRASDMETAPLVYSSATVQHSNSAQADTGTTGVYEPDPIESRTPTMPPSELDIPASPPHVTESTEADSPVSASISPTVVTSPSSVAASEKITVEAEVTHIKDLVITINGTNATTQSPSSTIPRLSVQEVPSARHLLDNSPPLSPSSQSWGRCTPSSEVSFTPSLTPTVSMFEASEVGVSHAHRVTRSTGRAVHVPATVYLQEEDPAESEYGSVSILPHSQSVSNIPLQYSEPDFTANPNDPTKHYFKAIVHGRVTAATHSTTSLHSTPQMNRVRRLMKGGEVQQSPGQGELATLLADAAKLEKSLSEGHIPSEESEEEGHSSDTQSPSDQNNVTDDDTGSASEKPPTPPPKAFRTTRYLSSSFRKLKKTSTNVLRTIPGGYPRPSLSTSSEISSEDSSPVVTPPADLAKDVQSISSGIGWPSMSPKKSGTLSRASSFADKILHRTRTKSSASSLDVPGNLIQPTFAPLISHPVTL